MGNRFSSKFSKHSSIASSKRGVKRKHEDDRESVLSSSENNEDDDRRSESRKSETSGNDPEIGLAPLSDIHTPKR